MYQKGKEAQQFLKGETCESCQTAFSQPREKETGGWWGGERLSSSSSGKVVASTSEEWRATSERFGLKKNIFYVVSRNRNFFEEKSNESFFFSP